MTNKTRQLNEHTIDATGEHLGRIAVRAALLLMGKDSANFERHLLSDNAVTITNASALDLSEKKRRQKRYIHHSGHPGGLKEETLAHLIERRGYGETVRRAIYGMLPKNKLRDRLMKQLTVIE